MTQRIFNLSHQQIAWDILQEHSPAVVDGVPLDGLVEAIAEKLQDAFDLGFKAAGGTIHDLRSGGEPVGEKK